MLPVLVRRACPTVSKGLRNLAAFKHVASAFDRRCSRSITTTSRLHLCCDPRSARPGHSTIMGRVAPARLARQTCAANIATETLLRQKDGEAVSEGKPWCLDLRYACLMRIHAVALVIRHRPASKPAATRRYQPTRQTAPSTRLLRDT